MPRYCQHYAVKGCADALKVKVRRLSPVPTDPGLSGYCSNGACGCCMWPHCRCTCHRKRTQK